MANSQKKSMTIPPLRSPKNASIADSPRKEKNLNETPRKSLSSLNLLNNPPSPSFVVNKLQVQKPNNKFLELKNIEIMLDNFSLSEQDQENPNVAFKAFQNENSPNKPLKIPEIKDISSSESEGDESAKPALDASFDDKLKNIAARMSKEEGGLNITFCDYLQSFVRKSPRYKEKLKLLNAGIDMVNERLNIFELFKNFREVEKLKLLLLDYEQAVLFENLPKPLLHAQADESADVRSCYEQLLRTGKLVPQDKRSLEVCEAYKNLVQRQRKESTEVDSKLLRVYDERFTSN